MAFTAKKLRDIYSDEDLDRYLKILHHKDQELKLDIEVMKNDLEENKAIIKNVKIARTLKKQN